MPATQARTGSRRRTINEINMVPFIDVMLVLLIIFMVTAPLITTGLVDLPTVGKSRQQPTTVIEVIVSAGGERLRVRTTGDNSREPESITLKTLTARVRELQAGNADTPVVISADKAVRYEEVVKVMEVLQKAEVRRVGLAVKSTGA